MTLDLKPFTAMVFSFYALLCADIPWAYAQPKTTSGQQSSPVSSKGDTTVFKKKPSKHLRPWMPGDSVAVRSFRLIG